MKTYQVTVASLLIPLFSLGSVQAANELKRPSVRMMPPPTAIQKVPMEQQRLRGRIRQLRRCPDPAVTAVDFQVLSQNNFKGRVRIIARMKNVGQKAFLSNPTQQALHLYQTYPGASGGTLVANRTFGNLKPGQTFAISYDRNWNASSPSEGEFPPSYRAIISYDPDITMDSNPNNDDCNGSNNSMEKSGTAINDLLR